MKISQWVVGSLAAVASPNLRRWLAASDALAVVARLPMFADANVYEIPDFREDQVNREIAKFNKKLEKMKIEGSATVQKMGERVRVIDEVTGRVVRVGQYRVQSDLSARLPGGWQFVALVEHLYDDEGKPTNVIYKKQDSTVAIPAAYRTSPATCDHCKLTRRRNETFIIADSKGKTMRVGRQCLKDYLGDASAERILALSDLTYLLDATMRDAAGGGEGGEYGQVSGFNLPTVLAVTANYTQAFGFVSGKDADATTGKMSTRNAVIDIFADARKNRKKIEYTEADRQVAAEAIAWAREIDPETTNDYLQNIRNIARSGIATERNLGTAVSIIPAYQRSLAQKAQAERERSHPSSRYVGDVGMRFGATGGTKKKPKPPPLIATVTDRRSQEKDFDGRSFIETRVDLTTSGGNDLIGFTSGSVPDFVKAGAIVKVYGTVKNHQIWKKTSRETTFLSRIDFLPATAEDLASAPPDPVPTGAAPPARRQRDLTEYDVRREPCPNCYAERGDACDPINRGYLVGRERFCGERVAKAETKRLVKRL